MIINATPNNNSKDVLCKNIFTIDVINAQRSAINKYNPNLDKSILSELPTNENIINTTAVAKNTYIIDDNSNNKNIDEKVKPLTIQYNIYKALAVLLFIVAILALNAITNTNSTANIIQYVPPEKNLTANAKLFNKYCSKPKPTKNVTNSPIPSHKNTLLKTLFINISPSKIIISQSKNLYKLLNLGFTKSNIFDTIYSLKGDVLNGLR